MQIVFEEIEPIAIRNIEETDGGFNNFYEVYQCRKRDLIISRLCGKFQYLVIKDLMGIFKEYLISPVDDIM